MSAITRRLFLVLAAATLAACASGRRAGMADPPTYVRVNNQSLQDMTIYVVRSSQRLRLGTVTSLSTARFQIPPAILGGPTSLRFQTDALAGGRGPVSMEVQVSPGDEIGMTIPPS